MIAFEVYLNGKRLAVAGTEDSSVLTAIVMAAGKEGPDEIREPMGKDPDYNKIEISLEVGGYSSKDNKNDDELTKWINNIALSINDEVIIKLLDTKEVDKPKETEPANSLDEERLIFEYAKENYFKLKEKYE